MIKLLEIFTFSDYRAYLRAWLEESRRNKTSNLSRLAQKIGVHTSFLAHVLAGIKDLSFEQAAELSEVLHHTSLEQEYFFSLLQIERAGTQKLKKYWTEKKQSILDVRSQVRGRVGEHSELSSEDRAIFYSSWIYVAVFVATGIKDGLSLDEVANLFQLSRSKADEILSFLTRTGICERKDLVYKMGESVVFIPNDSPLVVKHHTNWRIKAIQKMDTREPSEIFYSSPMSVSSEDFMKIRELLAKGIETSLEICRKSSAEEVICLNIDLFKVGTP